MTAEHTEATPGRLRALNLTAATFPGPSSGHAR